MTPVLSAHLLVALMMMTSSSAGDDRDCVGTSDVTSMQCELSKCFTADGAVLHVRPRCRSPRRIHITKLIFGVFATRHCPAAFNSCCINQTEDTWDLYRPQQQLFINISQLCNGHRHCTLDVDRADVISLSQRFTSDYVIIGFDCVTNNTGFVGEDDSTIFGFSNLYVIIFAVVALLLIIIIILLVIILTTRRKRASSRHSSRVNAAGDSQAKLSVSNFYDLYASIEPPYSPSLFLASSPTSIIKHSELLSALPPAEYVPMQPGKASKSLPELDVNWSTETNFDVNVTSSMYVSTPSARQMSRRRPASIQLVDHYEEIPADLSVPSPPTSPRRHASCDHIHRKPQPPTPHVAQGHSQGQRSSEVSIDGGVVDTMTRKPSYDDNDVILIDSAIYG